MKNYIFLLIFSWIVINTVSAQWSIGARVGGSVGVDFKNYPATGDLQIEVISAFNLDENIDAVSVTLLGEKFGALSNDGNLGAFLGAGVTSVFADDFLFGVNGIAGFDWRIRRIGFQVDWMPTFIFINDSYFSPINAAFTLRWLLSGRLLK